MIRALFVPLVLMCAGCEPPQPLQQTWDYDQCLRREIFSQCMAALPAGPTSTRYNDWNEVVEACEDVAKKQSVRNISQIKPECKP